MLVSSFGNRLSILLEETKVSKSQLADIINVGKSTITKYCTDEINPRLDKVKLIAEYFNVDIAWLLGHDVDRNGFAKSQFNDVLNDPETERLNRAIGLTCEYIRIRANLSVKEVADSLGRKEENIQKFENGQEIAPSTYPLRLCKLCKFPVKECYQLILFNYEKLEK